MPLTRVVAKTLREESFNHGLFYEPSEFRKGRKKSGKIRKQFNFPGQKKDNFYFKERLACQRNHQFPMNKKSWYCILLEEQYRLLKSQDTETFPHEINVIDESLPFQVATLLYTNERNIFSASRHSSPDIGVLRDLDCMFSHEEVLFDWSLTAV